MKNVILISLLLCLGPAAFSQNSSDIIKITSFYNNTFDSLEKTLNIKNTDRRTKFGLESRSYNYKNCKVLIESTNDDNKISKFAFMSSKNDNNGEIWYEITKDINANPSFTFVNSFVSEKGNDLYRKNLSFVDLISILRNIKGSSNLIYFITYKKDNLYYQFNVVDNTFFATIKEDLQDTDQD
ncbi:hypothetical protein [Chryseobacterium sp. 2VB]|uniref:hypothetical protein n=1 Tax=Chryseobacterium sp. 2VB TaxID=2502204 RepID=UPI0010F4B785|nr:hypothetical protein [Chryseobacterium sp. 2VB]